MTTVLWIGSGFGAIIGLVHACYLYRSFVRQAANALGEYSALTRAKAIYYGLWTIFLWIVFGSYVLILWILSVIAFAIYKTVSRSGDG